LYQETAFNNGQVIELPYSETQDQTFSFRSVSHGFWGGVPPRGIMAAYIDHEYKEPAVEVTWQEVCNDL
jgi:hypothetical protein